MMMRWANRDRERKRKRERARQREQHGKDERVGECKGATAWLRAPRHQMLPRADQPKSVASPFNYCPSENLTI